MRNILHELSFSQTPYLESLVLFQTVYEVRSTKNKFTNTSCPKVLLLHKGTLADHMLQLSKINFLSWGKEQQNKRSLFESYHSKILEAHAAKRMVVVTRYLYSYSLQFKYCHRVCDMKEVNEVKVMGHRGDI